jgi:hypothetical protein
MVTPCDILAAMRRGALVLLAGASFLAAGTAHAEEPDRVGVVVGVRVNVPEPRAEAVAQAIERVLEQELEVELVVATGAEVEGGLAPGCATDATCLSGVAARIEVDELLFLVVIGAGDRVRVEFSRRHPTTGAVTHPPALILDPDPDRIDQQIAGVAAALLPDASPRVEEQPAEVPVVIEKPIARGDGSGKRRAGLIAGGAGLALVGGAVYFAFKARSEADELTDHFAGGGEWTPAYQSLEDAHYRHRTWAAVLGIAGGVAVVTGATLYALGLNDQRRARDQSSVSVAPVAGGGVLVWDGAF